MSERTVKAAFDVICEEINEFGYHSNCHELTGYIIQALEGAGFRLVKTKKKPHDSGRGGDG